jgi:lysophospholipase L1-like esterase
VDNLGALRLLRQFLKWRTVFASICAIVFGLSSALAGTPHLAPLVSPSNLIVFDGDSLVAGYPANSTSAGMNLTFPDGTDFPSVVMKQLSNSWDGRNVARPSRELAATAGDKHGGMLTQIEDFDESVAPRIKQSREAGVSRIIVVNGGEPGNLLYFCALNNGNGGREAQEAAYQALKAYAAKVHEAGALFVDITMPARIATAFGGDRNLKADINAVNERVRDHCKTDHICDVVVDLALDPRMQDPGNTEYYVDGNHFTAAGYRIWADYVLRSLRQMLTEPRLVVAQPSP